MPGVTEVSVPRKGRRKKRANAIEGDVANLKDISVRYLTESVNMFSGCAGADRKKMSMGMAEIEKLNANEENMSELEG